MAKRRKTEAERRAERSRADREARREFLQSLDGIQSLEDAMKVMGSPPGNRSPERPYFSNFAFFMRGVMGGAFIPPMHSSRHEKSLYIKLIEIFDAEGALKPGSKETLTASLRAAIDEQPEF
jgi:hypothetical protein